MHKYEISEVENRNQDHDTSNGSIQHLNRKVVETSFSWNPEDNEHNDEPNNYSKVIILVKNASKGSETLDSKVQNPKQGKSQPSSPDKSDKASQNQKESDTKMTSADPHVYSAPQGNLRLPKLPGQAASIRAEDNTGSDRKPSLPVARPQPGVYATTADNNYGKVDYGKTGGGGSPYSGSKGTVADSTDSGYGNTNSGYIKQDNDDNNNSDKGSDGGKGGQNGHPEGDSDKKGEGMGGMKGFFKVPKSVMLAMIVCIIFLFVLVLLLAIILGMMMSSMGSDIDELKEENNILRGSIQKLQEDFNASSSGNLLKQVEELKTRMGNIESENLTDRISTLEGQDLYSSIQRLENLDIDNNLNALDTRISALEGENLLTRIQNIDTHVQNIENENLPNRTSTLEKEILANSIWISENLNITISIENLTDQVSILEAENLVIRIETLEDLNITTRLSYLETNVTDIAARIDDLEKCVTDNNNTIGNGQLNADTVEMIMQNLTDLETELNANNAEIETLQTHVSLGNASLTNQNLKELIDSQISELNQSLIEVNSTAETAKSDLYTTQGEIDGYEDRIGTLENTTNVELEGRLDEVNSTALKNAQEITNLLFRVGIAANDIEGAELAIDQIKSHLGLP